MGCRNVAGDVIHKWVLYCDRRTFGKTVPREELARRLARVAPAISRSTPARLRGYLVTVLHVTAAAACWRHGVRATRLLELDEGGKSG